MCTHSHNHAYFYKIILLVFIFRICYYYMIHIDDGTVKAKGFSYTKTDLSALWSRRVGHDWATSLSLYTFTHWRRKCQPTPVFLPGESQGRGSLVGCRLWGCRVRHRVRLKWLSSSSRASLGSETFYLILGVHVIVYLVSLENVFIDSIISVTNIWNLMHHSNKRIYSKLKKNVFLK